MFHLAVVFEKGDVVGGAFQAQDLSAFVVKLERRRAERVPDRVPSVRVWKSLVSSASGLRRLPHDGPEGMAS